MRGATWYEDVGSLYVEAFRHFVWVIEDNGMYLMLAALWKVAKFTGSPFLSGLVTHSCDHLTRRLENATTNLGDIKEGIRRAEARHS